MEWVHRSPQIHSTFSNLGFLHSDGYHINEHCNAALETILNNILTEDKYLCTYRRSISFGQNIKKDLIPLLINAKEDKTIELLLKIFVNLTIPIECLVSVDAVSKTDFRRHVIFEINNLLITTKVALTDNRATKAIIDFLKKNSNVKQKAKLSQDQCTNISNILLFLRNVLHIPEDINNLSPTYVGPPHTVQNQLLWNLFSQNLDTVLMKLMGIPDATKWAVTMVQLIALLYKDQHVSTLHKLLNFWLEAYISESSEDNESNTSPLDRGSNDSSPILTSEPMSDSSDTGGSGKSNEGLHSMNDDWEVSRNISNDNQMFQAQRSPSDNSATGNCKINEDFGSSDDMKEDKVDSVTGLDYRSKDNSSSGLRTNEEKKVVISENSDCGYGTQIENRGSISTSSNEDELPTKKPIRQKPHSSNLRNNNARSNIMLQEKKRKRIVKKAKTNIILLQSKHTLTDDDISNILKDFTVHFLLKGYNSLVQTLHSEILTNLQLEIDTSHFFWLLTYFLKFATQIELDLAHVCSVLSYDIISYLTAEGVNLCEQFELAVKLDLNELKSNTRRLHLVVTAIREFVQAIEMYKNSAHTSDDDQEKLATLQRKMCETHELRSLLVLLIRNYNPRYQHKQYLQDLIVTNHILLIFLDAVLKSPEYEGSNCMPDHVKQFAVPEMMYVYGMLLEDYESNGEFVNDCIFTIMHHVGGDLKSVTTLHQPRILKAFTSILKNEFEICDDWSDLIEYVINTFMKKPKTLDSFCNFRLKPLALTLDGNEAQATPAAQETVDCNETTLKRKSTASSMTNSNDDGWTEDEISSLSWNYMQCSSMPDAIGEVVKMFKEDGIIKARDSVIKELFRQLVINKKEFEKFLKAEMERNSKIVQMTKEMKDDEILKICEQLAQDGKSKFLDWVQAVLLDTCYAKIYLEKKAVNDERDAEFIQKNYNFMRSNFHKEDVPLASPVCHHSLLFKKPVPLVPWNCEQASICKDLKFLQLLHKLRFNMPVDSGKVFIRIPYDWAPDLIFDVASKISSIDQTKLKFKLSEVMLSSVTKSKQRNNACAEHVVLMPDNSSVITTSSLDNFYEVNKQKHLGAVVNFTPMPGFSYNSAIEEIQTPNWLKMVQKSQEYKITFDSNGSVLTKKADEKKVMKKVDDNVDKSPAPDFAKFVLPSATSAKPETNYNVPNTEPEYYDNSLCETASVASDLTRMYVSDEEEISEVAIRPILKVKTTCTEEPSSDTDNAMKGKRQRVHFFPAV